MIFLFIVYAVFSKTAHDKNFQDEVYFLVSKQS